MTVEDSERPAPRALKVAQTCSAVVLLALMAYVVLSVVLRYLGAPLTGVTEISSRWLMGPLVFVGIVIALVRNEHLAVDILRPPAGSTAERISQLVQAGLLAAFMALIAWYGWFEAVQALRRGESGIDSGQIMWVSRFGVVLMGVAAALLAVQAWLRADRISRTVHPGTHRSQISANSSGDEQ